MHMAKNKYLLASLLPVLYLAVLTSRVALAIPEKTPEFIGEYIHAPDLVGHGEYYRYFWKIYDAALYANQGVHETGKDFALLLEYKRDLSGNAIVEKSLELMADQGMNDPEKLEQWEIFLTQVIPDVSNGDQITGIRADGIAYFYFNGELQGQTRDPEFSEYFFSIWLGENTTAPDLRRDLLGQSPSGNQE
jgi:hypothetical protein